MLLFTEWISPKIQSFAKQLLSKAKVNASFDIPYVSGYNKEGTIFYIDEHAPKDYSVNGKNYNFHDLLLIHESTEKAAMMLYDYGYKKSHLIALKAERDRINELGLDWGTYNNFCEKWIKGLDSEKIEKVPKDIDLSPYEYYNDDKMISKMKEKMK